MVHYHSHSRSHWPHPFWHDGDLLPSLQQCRICLYLVVQLPLDTVTQAIAKTPIVMTYPSSRRPKSSNIQTGHQIPDNRRPHYLEEKGQENAFWKWRCWWQTFVLLLDKLVHVVWCDPIEKVDVLVRVELCHFAFRCRLCTLWIIFNVMSGCLDFRTSQKQCAHKYFHLLVQTIIHYKWVTHPYTSRFHSLIASRESSAIYFWSDLRVTRTIVKPSYIRVKEVALQLYQHILSGIYVFR